MEDHSSSDESWETSPWITEIAKFCCLHRELVSGWPTVYIISFYFIMSNLYDVYLSKIDEYALVKKDIFETFFTRSIAKASMKSMPNGNQDNVQRGTKSNYSRVAAAVSCLLEDENQVLSPEQKACVRSVLGKEANGQIPESLSFHLYVGQVEGAVHLVHCTCCAYVLAKVLIKILEKEALYRSKPERLAKTLRHMPQMVKRVSRYIDHSAYVDLIPHKIQLTNRWGSHVQFINGATEKRIPRSSHIRIAFSSAVILLYSLMPHAYAFRQLCKLIRRADHQTLIEVSSIIDRLLLNFPKELDVWSMKLFLMKSLFKHIPHSNPCMIDNIVILLDRRCMDVETFCLAVTAKGQMNGRIPWFLWNLYLHIRSITLKRVRKAMRARINSKIESYFLKMYSSLLVANKGYQGLFYLFLRLVEGDPEGIANLRKICEQAETNSSWQANIGILDNSLK